MIRRSSPLFWSEYLKPKHGFTIVELLIVIVIIAILAAITIVAYNGIQDRARASAIVADFNMNGKKIMTNAAILGRPPTTLEATTDTAEGINPSLSSYKLFAYCSSATEFAMAALATNSDIYYAKNTPTATKDNAFNVYNPCGALGIIGAATTYKPLPVTACSTENTTCTFTGKATIIYGSSAQERFTAKPNLSSPVGCNNSTFGDPAPHVIKYCYVLQ